MSFEMSRIPDMVELSESSQRWSWKVPKTMKELSVDSNAGKYRSEVDCCQKISINCSFEE